MPIELTVESMPIRIGIKAGGYYRDYHLTMATRIAQLVPEFMHIKRLTPKKRRKYLETCSGYVLDGICECIKNLSFGNIPLNRKQFKRLRHHKHALRKLSLKKLPRKKRRKIIQKGGFLPLVLQAALPLLTSLFGQ